MTALTARNLTDDHWKAAECSFYNAGTALAVGASVASALTLNIWGALSSATAAASLQQTAYLRGCYYDPGLPWEERPDQDLRDFEGGCVETTSGTLRVKAKAAREGGGDDFIQQIGVPCTRVIKTRVEDRSTPVKGWQAIAEIQTDSGISEYGNFFADNGVTGRPILYTELDDGAVCGTDYEDRRGIGKSYEVVDGDCVWTFIPVDSYVDSTGYTRILYNVIPNKKSCGNAYSYWTSEEGPIPVATDDEGNPVQPPEKEDCCDELNEKLDTLTSEITNITTELNTIKSDVSTIKSDTATIKSKVQTVIDTMPPPYQPGQKPWWEQIIDIIDTTDDILEIMDLFFGEDQKSPATEYTLQGICEDTTDDNPDQPVTTAILPEAPWATGVTDRLDALAFLLQAHLGYRTPTCGSKRPVLEGDFRTISFRSDEVSPYGKSRIRKRFRYRSVSGNELGAIVDHWRTFTFEAGPVCVIHKGASWGTPQVWAATADEGKRVIRHAAGEAGFDPDSVGEWIISGSRSPRIGFSGTMRVDTKGGYYWITARDGSNARPIVALT